ncbi:MAG: NADH-quinone oxidoreductase subunit H [Candidatus Methanomethylophilaceae archaeon]|nr:NADH-quinone oxidoreductase subunit H [Candidatus Methanomethylophilaceae archaeon]
MSYSSILDWIRFDDMMASPWYKAIYGDMYNLPFDIGYKLWEILGGAIAWLINLLFPGNGLSTWLISDAVCIGGGMIIFMVIIFLVVFVGILIALWEERKVLGRLMDRRGTMIGMKGFLQCVADGFKTFVKENTVPKKVDKMAYFWSLALVIGISVVIACMIPLSGRWFVVNYDTGLLLIMALFAMAPFLILVSGWAQNNKYTLIGGMRAAELMISYEVPMLIIIATACLMAGSFNIGDIVNAQYATTWYIVPMVLGFVTFLFCAIAESERGPFDLAEAEAELVEGWQTEYAGMKWALIMLADYLRGYVACAMVTILFLGGWTIPFVPESVNNFLPEVVFLLKTWFVFFLMVMIRGALPRVRTDQILNIGWRVFMPLSVVNLVIVLLLKVGGIF